MKWSRSVSVVGCHAEGEVGRVITGGVLPPPGNTLFEQKTYLEEQGDELRRFLIQEPRGGVFVHCNLLLPPRSPGAQAGFIIMEPTDYPPMSGSNSICVATVLLETGMVAMQEPVTHLKLDTPGGIIAVEAECKDGSCKSVRTTNVPSFVAKLDATCEVPGLGSIKLDIAYGGAFFAIVDAASLGLELTRENARKLVEVGEAIKAAAIAQHPVTHPENPSIRNISFVQFTDPLTRNADGTCEGRNTVVISPGKLDRSPCGTGTSARLAALSARGEIHAGEIFISRSILDTRFHCRIEAISELEDGTVCVVPSLKGRAWITGLHHYGLDPDDPFPEGYALTDTWYRTP